MNRTIWEKYKDADYTAIKKLFNISFQAIQKLVEKHPEQELFEKKKYK
ncbi:MAG: hypothetical protein ACJART_002299 [Maribacter sp.]